MFHIFVLSSVWEDLSNLEKDMYTRRALDLVCLDCGQIGSDGFKHMHRCQDDGVPTNGGSQLHKGVRGLPPVLPVCGPTLSSFLATSSSTTIADVHLWQELLQLKSFLTYTWERMPRLPPQLVCADGAQVRASTCLIHSDFP